MLIVTNKCIMSLDMRLPALEGALLNAALFATYHTGPHKQFSQYSLTTWLRWHALLLSHCPCLLFPYAKLKPTCETPIWIAIAEWCCAPRYTGQNKNYGEFFCFCIMSNGKMKVFVVASEGLFAW